jgi:hypothetical protein
VKYQNLKKDYVTYRSFKNFDREFGLLVKITSISVGKASFVKNVAFFFIKFEKSKISHTLFEGVLLLLSNNIL